MRSEHTANLLLTQTIDLELDDPSLGETMVIPYAQRRDRAKEGAAMHAAGEFRRDVAQPIPCLLRRQAE